MAQGTRRSGPPAVIGAVVGGLVLSGATVGTWVTTTVRREVAGAEVTEEITAAGAEFASLSVGLGVAAVLAGLALVPARGRPRRLVGGLVALTGVVGLVDVAQATLTATAAEGSLSGLPGLAGLGAVLVAGAGAYAAKRDRPAETLPERFDVGSPESDDEWHRAVDPQDEGDYT